MKIRPEHNHSWYGNCSEEPAEDLIDSGLQSKKKTRMESDVCEIIHRTGGVIASSPSIGNLP